MGFPSICQDHKNYEHVIPIDDYSEEHVYLIKGKAGITNVRQNGGKLIITGEMDEEQSWDIYSIRNGGEEKGERYTYPIMTNLRKDSFLERYQRKSGQVVKTRFELERFILGFDLEDYIEYQNCVLTAIEESQPESYPMNFFIKDEIREGNKQRQLLLLFRAKSKEQWVLRDLLSFITSEVQELYPEYHCRGKLV